MNCGYYADRPSFPHTKPTNQHLSGSPEALYRCVDLSKFAILQASILANIYWSTVRVLAAFLRKPIVVNMPWTFPYLPVHQKFPIPVPLNPNISIETWDFLVFPLLIYRGSPTLSSDRAIILIRVVVETPLAVGDGQCFPPQVLRLYLAQYMIW